MHSNIGACASFAAISGSTVANAATIGTVAIPQMERNGYNCKLFLGTLASGGTLGILIPPSINIIIYGALTDTSIPELYLAGIAPGAILALLFSDTETLLIIVTLYLVLGLFLETLTLMITTIPIIAPVVFALGYDPVWFGITLMLLIETALITAPLGLNLYVVQGVRSSGNVDDVILGALPFVLALMVMVGLLIAFPGLALGLPALFY